MAAQVSERIIRWSFAPTYQNIALVRNLKTGYLSSQFHVVFGDWFETVHSDQDMNPNEWENMCMFQRWELCLMKEQFLPSLRKNV